MSKASDDTEQDAIDDLIFGLAGFLGVHVERGRPKHVGLRALAESTVYALVEHTQATTPAPRTGITPVAVADLFYENLSGMWAQDVVTSIISAGMVTTPDDGEALTAWLTEKQTEERAAMRR